MLPSPEPASKIESGIKSPPASAARLQDRGRLVTPLVLKLETLSDTWEEFARRSGLHVEIPTLNRVGRSSVDELSSEALGAIREAYGGDFEVLSYEM